MLITSKGSHGKADCSRSKPAMRQGTAAAASQSRVELEVVVTRRAGNDTATGPREPDPGHVNDHQAECTNTDNDDVAELQP